MELQALVSLFRRRWWIVAVALVIGVAAGALKTASTTKVYRATARLYVNVPNAAGIREQAEGVQLTTQFLATYAKVVGSQKTTGIVSDALGRQLSPGEIRRAVSAATVPQTLLLEVRASHRDAMLAAELANQTALAMTTVIDELGANPTGSGVKATIIDRAGVPGRPITPQPRKDLTVGILLGLAMGAAVALGADALDKTIRTPQVASEIFGAPYLASVPRQRRLAAQPLSAVSAGSSMGESYRVLRTAVRFRDTAHPIKTVLITSAAAGDGKSTIASNLAIAMAQDGARVILIDADLRRTRLAAIFDLPVGKGLSNVLLGKVKLKDALIPWSRGLRILEVGTPGLNPSEALGSQAMVDVLNEAKSMADIVIIDAPPVLPVTDPTVLAALVDATIVVCRWGRTTLHAADATRQTLDNVGANVIGVVINAEGGGRSSNYYRHYSTRPAHRRTERETESIVGSVNGSAGLTPAAPDASARTEPNVDEVGDARPAAMRPGTDA
ncbi:MAG: polysaccharide biosynthesis tyrosine autokinase [Acidimicrobiales bacterium]|nr:polysaccharide biosynthesis tyrosine autokinase [Acidimicrobiales bacterium]